VLFGQWPLLTAFIAPSGAAEGFVSVCKHMVLPFGHLNSPAPLDLEMFVNEVCLCNSYGHWACSPCSPCILQRAKLVKRVTKWAKGGALDTMGRNKNMDTMQPAAAVFLYTAKETKN
jgi:hypothetical protein